ncbi:MOSC domain-containing protein [Phycisphaeraceae bacterium D3-23]
MTNPATHIGDVQALALRPAKGEPIVLVKQVTAEQDGGLLEEARGAKKKRGVTLLAAGQWPAVCDALGRDVPWTARRANILIGCDALLQHLGKTLCIGDDVRLEATLETVPCGHIESLTPGLFEALKPKGRGGLCCRVVTGGVIRVGDVVRVEDTVAAGETV